MSWLLATLPILAAVICCSQAPVGRAAAAAPSTAFNAGNYRNLSAVGLDEKTDLGKIFKQFFAKNPYSKFWSANKKWEDVINRGMAIATSLRGSMVKNSLLDAERIADISLSQSCTDDIKFINAYVRNSTNVYWLAHMLDSAGKMDPGMLAGNLASLGHAAQCTRLRAPPAPSNDSFDGGNLFAQQTAQLGERFRGKYCLVSIRPVLREKPALVSWHSQVLDLARVSNLSFIGEPSSVLKKRARDMSAQRLEAYRKQPADRSRLSLDSVPFESELYQSLIESAPTLYSLPKLVGVCYPSSCSRDDIRSSVQAALNEQHVVVDIEFDCEVDEDSAWDWFSMPRLTVYVFMAFLTLFTLAATATRYVLVSKLNMRLSHFVERGVRSSARTLLETLEFCSLDKTVGWLFVKTKPATHTLDLAKFSNRRSTSIDALRGALTLLLVYSLMLQLGGLPVYFMWSRWFHAMIPFYRSFATQLFVNSHIWTEAFYLVSAYLIAVKLFENCRPHGSELLGKSAQADFEQLVAGAEHSTPSSSTSSNSSLNDNDDDANLALIVPAGKRRQPPMFAVFALKRYVRLVLPMVVFMTYNYLWPRLSTGFVMQDQARKILAPCDTMGYTNLWLFHNYNKRNETCLWPSHVSANFFQLHLLSYPILVLLLHSLTAGRLIARQLAALVSFCIVASLILVGMFYPAAVAKCEGLIVPFLVDYLDADNYQRVIDFMYLPVVNHLIGYMLGIVVAYAVSKRRMLREKFVAAVLLERRCQSGKSSADRHWSQTDKYNFEVSPKSHQSIDISSSSELTRRQTSDSPASLSYPKSTQLSRLLSSSPVSFALDVACVLAMACSLTSTLYWNALARPMTETHSYWYVALTKVCFLAPFAYVFHKHIATRQNSLQPWLLTRFLVAIGRMSLTVFYISFLVIWFELLSSPYQWHPSHYFVSEKYAEIIFMTLIFSMLAYGTLEGPMKAIEYSLKGARQAKVDEADEEQRKGGKPAAKVRRLGKFCDLFIDEWHKQRQKQRQSGANQFVPKVTEQQTKNAKFFQQQHRCVDNC